MSLTCRTRMGPFEIVGVLGAGGMGEVYRAVDARLGRDVAIKVLPPEFAADADRLRRFEQEARTAGGLNHPNLVTLHDVGEHAGRPYLVMELLEGETLRARLAPRPLPVRRAVEIARGIAEGLAAAHDKGIVHRDLKPENLFLTRDGRIKILDFGLAKLRGAPRPEEALADDLPTHFVRGAFVATDAGTVLGSVGYMSPEQVRGRPVDARSDVFALGVILWEMLTGSRPFNGPSAVEAMHAIVRDEPPDLDPALKVPPVLERIVRTCLSKEPAARFHSAHDLAFALEALPSGSHPSLATAPLPARQSRRWALIAAVLLVTAGLAGLSTWPRRPPAPQAMPSFRKLTFGRGTIDGARFVPGTGDIAYSARWQGDPWTVSVLHQGTVEPRALDAPGAMLLATSAQGGAAVMTRPALFNGFLTGAVSVLPLAGGGSRDIGRRVVGADFAGEMSDLCLVTRVSNSGYQIEWPQGEPVLKSERNIFRNPRIRDGRLAFFESSPVTVSIGDIRVLEKGGRARSLIHCEGFTSLAWGPDGREVWFSTFDGGESLIQAVSLEGSTRLLLRHAGRLELVDVDPSGRSLAVVSSQARQAFGRAAGAAREVDLTWLDAQLPTGIRADGSAVLLAHAGDWEMAPERASIYLRPLTGGPAVNLGSGSISTDLSSDGQWVAVLEADAHGRSAVRLLPTGAGPSRSYPLAEEAITLDGVWFHPSNRAVDILSGATSSIGRLDLATGVFTPRVVPGPVSLNSGLYPSSPNGRRLLLLDDRKAARSDGPFLSYVVLEGEGAPPKPARGNLDTEAATGWAPNNEEVYLYDRNAVPANVVLWNPLTGARRPFLQIAPSDPTGVWGISNLVISADGRAYAYSVTRKLSDLYMIEGLK